MTRPARGASANDRFKASYDTIVAASLIRAAVLHVLVLSIYTAPSPPDVFVERTSREIRWERLDVISCRGPAPFVLPPDTLDRLPVPDAVPANPVPRR